MQDQKDFWDYLNMDEVMITLFSLAVGYYLLFLGLGLLNDPRGWPAYVIIIFGISYLTSLIPFGIYWIWREAKRREMFE